MYIMRRNFLVIRTIFYDSEGKPYRQYDARAWDLIDGYPTVTKARMTDLRTKGYTDNEYADIKYNIGLPESIFTERYLRQAPREYLR